MRQAEQRAEPTLRLPALAAALAGALVKTALQATTIVLGFVAVISLLVLLARL